MSARIIDTIFGKFKIEPFDQDYNIAVNVGDEDFYYNVPKGMSDEGIQEYFKELADFEE